MGQRFPRRPGQLGYAQGCQKWIKFLQLICEFCHACPHPAGFTISIRVTTNSLI